MPSSTRVQCHAPSANELFVAGTFNDWNPQATPLKKGADGTWAVDLALPIGRYEYKFIVDGAWCCAPGRPDDGYPLEGCVSNECGTLNSVLQVE